MLYLGHFEWLSEDQHWAAPAGASTIIDLRSLASQGMSGEYGDHPYAIFQSEQPLGDDYYSLGELYNKPNGRVRSAFQKMLGVNPKGDTLEEWLWDITTDQSHPDGAEGVRPLMPGTFKKAKLMLGRRILFKRMNILDRSVHSIRCLEVIREGLSHLSEETERKALGFLCYQHDVDFDDDVRWKKFLKPERRNHTRPEKPSTTITDDFNRADSTSMGGSWTEVNGNWFIASNQVGRSADNILGVMRWEQDFSGSDMGGSIDITAFTNNDVNKNAGPMLRMNSGNDNGYFAAAVVNTGVQDLRLFKRVSSVTTLLSGTGWGKSLPDRIFGIVDGSSVFVISINDGSTLGTTDTAIPTGVRGGIAGFHRNTGVAANWRADNWRMSDIHDGAAESPLTLVSTAARAITRSLNSSNSLSLTQAALGTNGTEASADSLIAMMQAAQQQSVFDRFANSVLGVTQEAAQTGGSFSGVVEMVPRESREDRIYAVGGKMVPLGYEQLPDLSAVQFLCPPPRIRVAEIQTSGEAVRWRDDGVDPTSGVGMLLPVGETMLYTGDFAKLRLIEAGPSAEVNVSYYF